MYGKIVDNKLVIAGDTIKIENGSITNPTEEQLIGLGYKVIEYAPKPEYDDEEEKLVEEYRENIEKTTILVCYEKVALTDEEHNEIIKQEIIEEENKLTPRRQREIDLNKEGALQFVQQIENNIVALRTKLR